MQYAELLFLHGQQEGEKLYTVYYGDAHSHACITDTRCDTVRNDSEDKLRPVCTASHQDSHHKEMDRTYCEVTKMQPSDYIESLVQYRVLRRSPQCSHSQTRIAVPVFWKHFMGTSLNLLSTTDCPILGSTNFDYVTGEVCTANRYCLRQVLRFTAHFHR